MVQADGTAPVCGPRLMSDCCWIAGGWLEASMNSPQQYCFTRMKLDIWELNAEKCEQHDECMRGEHATLPPCRLLHKQHRRTVSMTTLDFSGSTAAISGGLVCTPSWPRGYRRRKQKKHRDMGSGGNSPASGTCGQPRDTEDHCASAPPAVV